MSTEQQGIDVAWPQGKFNWTAEHGKIAFGACKATQGLTITDDEFVTNWNALWFMNASHTVPRFAYHIMDFADSPEAQAEFCVNTVKPHGLLAGDNLVLDVSDASIPGLTPAAAAALGVRFLREANTLAPGRRVLVYTDVAFALAGNCEGMGSWFLWQAEYGVSAPRVPAPWKTWTLWQKSDNGLDLDVFNGTQAELLSFCRMPATR